MSFDINNLDTINYVFNPMLLLVNIFSVITSILTLYIVITKCGYKIPEMTIILILSITHTISSASELIFSLLKLIFGHDFLSSGSTECIISAITVISTLRFEIFTVGFLAFIRYVIVCHNIKKGSKFWLISYTIVISPLAAMYIYPIIKLDANIFASRLYCSYYLNTSPNMTFLSFLNALIWVIPCWVSTYCYFVIGIKVYKQLKQMENEAIIYNENNQLIRIRKQKRNLTIQLVVVFIAFNLAYSPIYITLLLRYITGYARPPFVDAIMILIYGITRAIDPIITITFQPELNHEFRAIVTKSIAKLKCFIVNLFQ